MVRVIFFGAIAMVFACVGIPLTGVFLSFEYTEYRLDQDGVVTRGSIKTARPKDNEVYLIYEYFVDGDHYSDAQTISSGSTNHGLFEQDEYLRVTYLPDDPGINRLEPRDAEPIIYLSGLGGIAGSIIAGILAMNGFRRSRKPKPTALPN